MLAGSLTSDALAIFLNIMATFTPPSLITRQSLRGVSNNSDINLDHFKYLLQMHCQILSQPIWIEHFSLLEILLMTTYKPGNQYCILSQSKWGGHCMESHKIMHLLYGSVICLIQLPFFKNCGRTHCTAEQLPELHPPCINVLNKSFIFSGLCRTQADWELFNCAKGSKQTQV